MEEGNNPEKEVIVLNPDSAQSSLQNGEEFEPGANGQDSEDQAGGSIPGNSVDEKGHTGEEMQNNIEDAQIITELNLGELPDFLKESDIPAYTETDAESGTLTHDIIKDMIASYGRKEDLEQSAEYLEKLKSADAGQGALWENIMKYWDFANNDMEVHIDTLPDSLPKDDSLCLMVLGFELNYDGSMQKELIGRLEMAMECSKQYPNAYILCTGGGSALGNPSVTEADLMGQWLLENGLDSDRLIIENKSMTTAENALNSYAILLDRYPQVKSIAVLSSSYHIAWGSLLLESALMKAAYEQQTPPLHVISNCAYDCYNAKYADTVRFETGGMMQLIGEEYLALQYYSGQIR